jgi:Eco57I restriction-modification methylase/restriction endonuclease TaqI-like protein/type I restriction and modification enzyme subunit R-like protein
MPAPQLILDLVARFSQHIDVYKSGSYNETQLRRDFLDPFFKELGWDMDNTSGYAEAYRDLIHEDKVKVGSAVKAPDYGFRIGGQRKFFLEAKRPAVHIKEDASPAYQLRRYAWSAKLPLSILSDFEEFAVYDTRVKPAPSDAASNARIFYCRFDEYARHWDHIASIFSRESILKGSFDKFAATTKGKRGTAEVDGDFLATMEGWRADLARNLALRNLNLTQQELNFAVQSVLDRIIFLRICEDRGIEDYERLKKAAESKDVYKSLIKLFHQADDRYNSGLFHFHAEKSRHEQHDSLTPTLVLDDDLLRKLIRGLYYPDSPYEFSVLSADILGQVYEQFLGKVITLTVGHRAQVEDKPQVKKAGGVFYTPKYIVDYIVHQAIRPLVEGKTPKQIEHIRILDPACGSGSFLIGAFQFLLDWYFRYYTEHEPQRHSSARSPKLVAASGGGWALTTNERKRILLMHIYGVDIDSQAVEVTKLSLLLKVLEGETAQSLQRELIHERVLPDLGDNIKCGNSLIGRDFYAQTILPTMDAAAHLFINVFDWDGKDGFPEVMKAGGFDAVIGNPPYLRIQGLQEYYGNQIDYFMGHFKSASKRFDFYMLFIEKGYRLLSPNGSLGFICPHKFVTADYASNLRAWLAKRCAIRKLISFGQNLVFSQASTYTGILLLTQEPNPYLLFAEIPRTNQEELSLVLDHYTSDAGLTSISYKELGDGPWRLAAGGGGALLKKLATRRKTIGDVFSEVLVGVQSGIDDVHVMKEVDVASDHLIRLHSEREDATVSIECAIAKPFLIGQDVSRYQQVKPNHRCVYPYHDLSGKTRVLDETTLRSQFPHAYSYLKRHQKYLTEIRRRQHTNPVYWYSCHRSRDIAVFERERIISPEISKGCNFTIAPAGIYHNTQVYSYVPNDNQRENIRYWLGILNSKVLWWFLTQTGTVLRGGYFRFKTNYIRPFPVPIIDHQNRADQATHDRIVALVSEMLSLHLQLAAAKTPHEQTALRRQITVTDARIDREVYELYALTEEEIALVETSA